MPRFITNRWWTFILAIVLGIGLLVALPADRSHAASSPGSGSIGGDDGIPGGGPSYPGNGDPDLPIGKTRPASGGVARPVSSIGLATVGDGRLADNALMWRLRIVMSVIRTLYLR
jgi:hypothetical protein